MESMFESSVDGDSNPGFIIFKIGDDVEKLEKMDTQENTFDTIGVTIGAFPKLIFDATEPEHKKILKYLFLLKLKRFKYDIKYRFSRVEDNKHLIIEELKYEDVDVHTDFRSGEFDGECVKDYLPELRVGQLIEDLLRIHNQ